MGDIDGPDGWTRGAGAPAGLKDFEATGGCNGDEG